MADDIPAAVLLLVVVKMLRLYFATAA